MNRRGKASGPKHSAQTAAGDPLLAAADSWIERGQAAMNAIEPPEGFEARVLMRLHAADERAPQTRRWAAVLASAAALIVLAIALLWPPAGPRGTRAPHSAASLQSPAAAAAVPIASAAGGATAPMWRHRRARLGAPAVRSASGDHGGRRLAASSLGMFQEVNAAAARRMFSPRFPTPTPLSPEERAMIQFLRLAPPAEVAAFARESSAALQPPPSPASPIASEGENKP